MVSPFIPIVAELEELSSLTFNSSRFLNIDQARWQSQAAHHAQVLLDKHSQQLRHESSQLHRVAQDLQAVHHEI